jgi:hypothetical protein
MGAKPMPSSTDERIQQIIARKKAQGEADKLEETLAIEQRKAKDKRVADLRAKWADETHVIEESIKEIQRKTARLGVKVTFQHVPANPGSTIGTAIFSGSSPNTANSTMRWNVLEDGLVDISYDRPGGAPGANKFQIETADRATYESKIMDFIDLIV